MTHKTSTFIIKSYKVGFILSIFFAISFIFCLISLFMEFEGSKIPLIIVTIITLTACIIILLISIINKSYNTIHIKNLLQYKETTLIIKGYLEISNNPHKATSSQYILGYDENTNLYYRSNKSYSCAKLYFNIEDKIKMNIKDSTYFYLKTDEYLINKKIISK